MSTVTAGKATRVTEAITSRRLSAKQVRERHEAATPRGDTIASNGQIVELVSTPTQEPRVIKQMPKEVTD